MDISREILYPLGFISGLLFGSRFLYQWIYSEKRHQSLVPPLFWKISLIGNLALWLHSVIQMQYPIAFVQAVNSVISWRNLNLLHPPSKRLSFSSVLLLMMGATGLSTLLFYLQSGLFLDKWLRIPMTGWNDAASLSLPLSWHLLGCFGLLLFSSRFFFQWWSAEKQQSSHLNLLFWWLSLAGSLLNIAYFLKIGDTVNLLGNTLGIVPYIRNIMLINRQKNTETSL